MADKDIFVDATLATPKAQPSITEGIASTKEVPITSSFNRKTQEMLPTTLAPTSLGRIGQPQAPITVASPKGVPAPSQTLSPPQGALKGTPQAGDPVTVPAPANTPNTPGTIQPATPTPASNTPGTIQPATPPNTPNTSGTIQPAAPANTPKTPETLSTATPANAPSTPGTIQPATPTPASKTPTPSITPGTPDFASPKSIPGFAATPTARIVERAAQTIENKAPSLDTPTAKVVPVKDPKITNESVSDAVLASAKDTPGKKPENISSTEKAKDVKSQPTIDVGSSNSTVKNQAILSLPALSNMESGIKTAETIKSTMVAADLDKSRGLPGAAANTKQDLELYILGQRVKEIVTVLDKACGGASFSKLGMS